MREAADKQQSFPLCEVLVDILQEFLIDIGCDRLDLVLRMDRVDRLLLHVGRIVGDRRLLHQGEFDGFPVIGLPFLLDIAGKLVLPVLS